MTDDDVKPGVYRHYKDGLYYQVLFTATLNHGVKQDDPLDVFVVIDEDTAHLFAEPAAVNWRAAWDFPVTYLFTARSHEDYVVDGDDPLDLVIYVPLYAHKPGRRIAARSVKEFVEMVPEQVQNHNDFPSKGALIPRFTYVGDVIPQ